MSLAHKAKVLAAYKELLSLIRRLPNDRKTSALDEARQTIRNHANENDLGKQSDLFKQLAARITFLRTITPKRPGDVSSIGAGHFVLREGKLVKGAGMSAGTRSVQTYGYLANYIGTLNLSLFVSYVYTYFYITTGLPTVQLVCLKRMKGINSY
jgi:hypothetical protein